MYWMQKVGITATKRILYSPIDRYVRVPATLEAHTGRVVIYPAGYPSGLHAGCYTGRGEPIIPAEALRAPKNRK